jgi:hypothetical protein
LCPTRTDAGVGAAAGPPRPAKTPALRPAARYGFLGEAHGAPSLKGTS